MVLSSATKASSATNTTGSSRHVTRSHRSTPARPSSTELPDPARPSSNELLTLRPSDPYADWDFDLDDEGLFHLLPGPSPAGPRGVSVRGRCVVAGRAQALRGETGRPKHWVLDEGDQWGGSCRRSAWPDMTRTVICQLGVVDQRSMDRHHL